MSHFTSRIRLIFIKIFSALRLSNFFFPYEEAIRYWSFPEMLGEYKPNLDVFLKVLSFSIWRKKAFPGEKNTMAYWQLSTLTWLGLFAILLYLHLFGKLSKTWNNKEENNKHPYFCYQELPTWMISSR